MSHHPNFIRKRKCPSAYSVLRAGSHSAGNSPPQCGRHHRLIRRDGNPRPRRAARARPRSARCGVGVRSPAPPRRAAPRHDEPEGTEVASIAGSSEAHLRVGAETRPSRLPLERVAVNPGPCTFLYLRIKPNIHQVHARLLEMLDFFCRQKLDRSGHVLDPSRRWNPFVHRTGSVRRTYKETYKAMAG